VTRFLRGFPIALLLPFAALPATGQEAAAASLRCVVFPIQDFSAGAVNSEYVQSITEAVAAAARAHGLDVLPDATWKDAAAARSIDPSATVQEAAALQVAGDVSAEVAVTGYFTVSDAGDIYYSIQCWDVGARALAASIQKTTSFDLAFFSELSAALDTGLFSEVHLSNDTAVAQVSFTSPDQGMEVLLSGDLDIGRITDGRLSWPLPSLPAAGTKVTVEKRKPGYHTASQTVTLVDSKDIPLAPLVKESSAATELVLTVGQLLGAGIAVRGYQIPDWVFISTGAYIWVQPPATFSPMAMIHSDLSVGAGGYLLPPDFPVRVGLSSGVGLILSAMTLPGLPVYTDLYIDVMNVWVEGRVFGLTIFARVEGKYALGFGANLLGLGWMEGQLPILTVGVLSRW
jgi:hypothetical protein